MRMRTNAAKTRRAPDPVGGITSHSAHAPYTFLEFFAGGGMARIGLGERWRCAFANDFDGQKCAAYRDNFGAGELLEGDIAALTPADLPAARADLAWASFPCQDLSLAGARGGIGARRSGTFFAFWRLIEALAGAGRAPHLIVIENVAGLLTSNGGEDFVRLAETIAQTGYRLSASIIDAQSFTPQSRPRLFIFGFGPAMAPPTNTDAPCQPMLAGAVKRLSGAARANWIGAAPTPRLQRNARLSDVIDWDEETWHGRAETRRLIAMMSKTQRARLDAIVKNGARRAGAGFRRTRTENGKPVQRFEARFDGLAGCLRTPAGGSSRQIVVAVDRGKIRTRLMTPREAARLMGLPDDYALPARANAALKLCGDGVCVPVARWIGENILEPALAGKRKAAAA